MPSVTYPEPGFKPSHLATEAKLIVTMLPSPLHGRSCIYLLNKQEFFLSPSILKSIDTLHFLPFMKLIYVCESCLGIFSYGCVLLANTLKFWSHVVTYEHLDQDMHPSRSTNWLPQPREWMSLDMSTCRFVLLNMLSFHSLSSLFLSCCQSFSCLRSELAQAITLVEYDF